MVPSERLNDRLLEAARYALLRRLMPAIRHDLAGALQPISMMAVLLEKRLQKPDPDLPALGKNSSAISALARDAATDCMDLMSWLAPKSEPAVALAAGVADSISLLTTELSFKGFNLVNRTDSGQAGQTELPRSLLRNGLMACLIALTDTAQAPADAVLTARVQGDEVTLVVAIEPQAGGLAPGLAPGYRQLGWDDVERLVAAEAASVSYSADRAELRYTRVTATVNA